MYWIVLTSCCSFPWHISKVVVLVGSVINGHLLIQFYRSKLHNFIFWHAYMDDTWDQVLNYILVYLLSWTRVIPNFDKSCSQASIFLFLSLWNFLVIKYWLLSTILLWNNKPFVIIIHILITYSYYTSIFKLNNITNNY